MHHAGAVRGGERPRQIGGERDQLVGWQARPALEVGRQVLALHELHRQGELAVDVEQVVQAHDARVGHLARGAQLPANALEPAHTGLWPAGQELDRDDLVGALVARAEDLAHRPRADPLDKDIAITEAIPRLDRALRRACADPDRAARSRVERGLRLRERRGRGLGRWLDRPFALGEVERARPASLALAHPRSIARSAQSRQHSTPPPLEPVFFTLAASFTPSVPQDHGVPRALHLSWLNRSSGAHEAAVVAPKAAIVAPMLPQPNRSFCPLPQAAPPGPLVRCTKNPVPLREEHPVALRDATACGEAHTLQPSAHRSLALQPMPFGFAPSSPPWRPQAGLPSVVKPATDQPPAHAAMFGCVLRLAKPSRWPSAQPICVAERQHSTPPPLGPLFVTLAASAAPSTPQLHGAPSATQRSLLKRSSGEQEAAAAVPKAAGAIPMLPQPKRSFCPAPQTAPPAPLVRCTKKPVPLPEQEVELRALTASGYAQTSQPSAHRSFAFPIPPPVSSRARGGCPGSRCPRACPNGSCGPGCTR